MARGKAGFPAKHQEEWRVPGSTLYAGIVRHAHFAQILIPVGAMWV